VIRKVFVDSDVVLDLLGERHPFHTSAQRLFSMAEQGKVEVFTSPLVMANVYYVLRKLAGAGKARDILRRLRPLLRIESMHASAVDWALTSDFQDLEDAIQYRVAVEAKADALLTRNAKDFRSSQIPVFSPEEFVNQI